MKETIEQAFAKCLEMMTDNGEHVSDCLALYPQFENELRELFLLRADLAELSDAHPSQQFVQNAAANLIAKLPDHKLPFFARVNRSMQVNFLQPVRKMGMVPVIIGLILLFLVVAGGIRVVDASAPGDVFYNLDRTLEQVRLRLADVPENAMTIRLEYAFERLEEANRKLAEDELEQAVVAFDGYHCQVYQIAKMIAGTQGEQREALLAQFYGVLGVQRADIKETIQSVPEKARIEIQNALDAAPALDAQMRDDLEAPIENGPQGTDEEAPQEPPEEAPQAPPEDAPQGDEGEGQCPPEDAPEGPPEDAPQEPPKDAPQGQIEDDTQGSIKGIHQGRVSKTP